VIYVKRGEGTYLANIDSHQLYKLIAKYLIRTDRQYEELNELMHMIDYYYEHKYQGMKTVKDDDNQIVNRIYSLVEKYANGYENEPNGGCLESMLKDIFFKLNKKASDDKRNDHLGETEKIMTKCPNCKKILYSKDLHKRLNVCSNCDYHLPITSTDRMA